MTDWTTCRQTSLKHGDTETRRICRRGSSGALAYFSRVSNVPPSVPPRLRVSHFPLKFFLNQATSLVAVALVLGFALAGHKSVQANERLLLADDTAIEARLADALADGKLAFDAGGTRRTPEAEKIVRWGGFFAAGRGTLAVLDDGDLIVRAACALDGDALRLTSEQFGDFRLPLTVLRGLVLRSPTSGAERDRLVDELARWTTDAGATGVERVTLDRVTLDRVMLDRVMLDNGDAIEGKLIALDDTKAGDAKLIVETDAGVLTLSVERVRAIAFGRRGDRAAAKDELRFVVGTRDGSRVTATSVSLSQAGLEVVTAWGAKLTIARENVAAIQTLGGRATYLSDLTASGYKHVPYLSTAWPLSGDRHVGGGRMRAGGREFLKGIGMHSAASATYALDKPYRRFEAELAIDDSVFGDDSTRADRRRPPRGSVVFRVYTDGGDGGWKLRHTSETIRGGDEPTAVSVDIAGAKRISLIVDFADRADEHDRADWLDARLVK